jgi:hypothetical protein
MEAIPQAPVAQKEISLVGKIVLILLMGGLSMFFAEVMSGSSVLWFLQPWGWIVTLPLYMFHTLLLLNLALIFKRRSLSSLYLWGVIFGLYESWITKVVWAGYMGQAPAVGTFLGFAIFEGPLIVLFWHPVMSFILPILTFQVLSGEKSLLPGHIQMLGKNRTTWAILLFIMIVGASSLAMNSKYSVISTAVTLIGSILFILLFYWIASKKYAAQFSIRSLMLGKVGMYITILYMFVLYFGAFFFLLPERTPKLPTLLLTLCIYALIVALLWLKKPDTEAETPADPVFGLKDAGILFGFLLVLAMIFCLVPSVSYILELCLYILIFTLGPLLFGYVLVRVFKERFARPAVH